MAANQHERQLAAAPHGGSRQVERVCSRLRTVSGEPTASGLDAFFSLRFDATQAISTYGRRIHLPLQQLGPHVVEESWCGPAVTSEFSSGELFSVVAADHVVVLSRHVVNSDIAEATRATYVKLLSLVRDQGFPHACRIWNIVPAINHGSGDAENYVRFSVGRAAAYDELGISRSAYPAATAVGCAAGLPLTVIMLASSIRPTAVENPRQTSAYRYPRRYGPRAPTFARGAVLQGAAGATLFISGTASIVGHRSLHVTVEQQLHETLANIDELVDSAIGRTGVRRGSWRVYLRNPGDLERVQAEVERRLGRHGQVMYVQADICRRELLVEIEGTCEVAEYVAAGC
jgi:chorismate lyase/3-hydroxybenzoate synthase